MVNGLLTIGAGRYKGVHFILCISVRSLYLVNLGVRGGKCDKV